MALRKIKILGYESFSFDTGIAILDPTYHNYEDAYADGYVKAVFCAWHADEGCYVISKPVFSQVQEDKNGKLYFNKFRKKYYLDDLMRTNIGGYECSPAFARVGL